MKMKSLVVTELDVCADSRKRNYQELVRIGAQVSNNAYAPFSDYRVGAAMLTCTGRVYQGCNTENLSIAMTVHGEMAAISAGVGDGALVDALERGFAEEQFIDALSIIPQRMKNGWPCGHCCDFMSTWGTAMNIVVEGEDGQAIWKPLRELYPYAPDPKLIRRIAQSGELLKLESASQTPFVQGSKLNTSGRTAASISHDLLKIAQGTRRPYAPYTKRPCRAAVLLWDDSVYRAVNVENVGYTGSSHASLNAIANAISDGALDRAIAQGKKPTEFVKTIAHSVLGLPDYWPFGSERQALCDWGLDLSIAVEQADGAPASHTLGELFPAAFVPNVLSYWTQP
jgi:cytidine deaminase